jgi:hypothetical protein
MKKIIFLILTLFGLTQMNAQIWTIASCSNLGTTTYGPMYSVAGANATSREAVIYPSSQLATLTGQTLNAMYFKRSTAAGTMAGTPNFKIYLKEVSNSDWGAAAIDWATETTGATLVYDSDPASIVGSAAGWLSFPLSTNFIYSGTQNLAVFFEYQNTTASTSISWNYEYTAPCISTTNSNTTKYSNNTTGTLMASLASTNYRRPLIGFDFVVSCPAPTLLTATNVTTNSVDLNWTTGASETQWEYVIIPAAASIPSSGTLTSTNPLTDSSLLPATTYKAYIRAVCGAGDNSVWIGPVNFTTACVPISTLPWSENFDTLTAGTNVFPPCWAYTNTTSTWSISSTPVANSGANSLRRTWSTDGWAFTPPATLTAGTSYTLSYFMKTNDTVVGYDLTIGVGTAQTEADMTTNLSTVTGYQGPTWTKFTHEFTPSTTGDYSFGIHVVAPNAPNGINFDDFKLDLTPSCVEPTLLAASAVTSSTATVSWTESLSSPANGYEYYFSTTNVAPLSTDTATGTVAAGIATVDLSTLNPSTTYYVWVRSACSSTDKSAWSTSTSFTTACVALTTLPWTENFDALTTGTNIFPSCWAYLNTTSSWTIDATNVVAHSGANSLRRSWSTDGWAYTPMATLTDGTSYTFSYYMRTKDTTVGYDLTIGVGNGQSAADMTTTLSTTTGYQNPAWTKFTFEFTPSTTGDYSFGVHVVAPVAPNGINFDDFTLDLTPTCVEPTLLVASAVSSSSATVSWTEPNVAAANGYEYIVSTSNITPLTTDVATGFVAAGIATVDLLTLNPSTTYYVWVRSNCSPTDKSAWSTPTSFTTACVALTTLPWTENFDALTTGTNIFPSCWAYLNTTSSWTIDATNVTAYSGANSLRRSWSTNGWAYTPMATLTAGTSYTFSYYMRTKDTTVGYDITVGVGNGQSAVDMTTTLSTTTGYQNPTWTKFTFEFTPTTTGDYSFGVHVVAPVAPNGINFDDFKLELSPSVIPTCATNIIATPSATCGNFATTITWDAVADSTGYNLTIGTITGASDILNNVNIGANTTYSFIGNIATTYYFKLTPFNGVGPATGCVESSFVTASNGCYCPSVPTSNDGSGITNIQLATIDYPIADVTYVDNTATVVDLAQGANTNLQISFATGFTYGTNVWIDFDNNFTFDTSEIVYTGTSLSTNPTILDASFVMPATATLGQHTMRIGTADSGQVPPNPCFSGSYGVTVDYMVNVIAPPTCEAPMSLAASNVTIATATFTWTASTSSPANGYEYYVSTTNTAPDATTMATGTVGTGMTMVDLINLSPATTYYVWVRSLCSSTLSSSWSVSTTFATLALPTCEAPMSLVPSNVTIATATVSWNASTSSPANGYEYYVSTTNTAPDATTMATGTVGAGMTMIDLINLSPATTYYVWVRSLCSSTLASSWSVSTTFTTLVAPTPPVNDDCSGAIVLTPAGDFATAVQTGTIFSATSSNFIPTCQTSVSSDVWYTVVIPASGNITLETQNAVANSMTNSVIAAYTGACNTFVQVGCNDDNGTSPMSLLSLTAQTPGSTLYIGVWNNGNPTTVSNSEFKIAAYDASLANDTFNNNSFSYYPNPVKDVLNLSYSKNITNVAVYNLLGQEVIVKTVNANQSQIDMSKLSEGTYMVKVTADNQVKTIKVIKQ